MAIYGGNWARSNVIRMAGNAHVIHMGDSVHFGGRQYTPAHYANLQIVYPNIRWNYMVAGGYSASTTNYWQCSGYNNSTQTSYGLLTADTATPNGPKLLRAIRSQAYASNIADGTVISSNTTGIQINRQYSNTPNTTAQYAWPAVPSTARPWFHDSGSGDGYMKGKLMVAGRTSANCDSIDVFLKRWSSTGAVSNETTPATADFSTLEANILASAWTSPLADLGTYTASGYAAGDKPNDHSVQIGLRTTTGFDETGKYLDIVGGVFARCDSGGTIATNAAGASCGYDAFGRSGSAVGDWANSYAVEADWTQYFTHTVHNPTGVTVMDIELGRNVTPVTEQTDGVVNATWSTYYQAFITMLRAAYATAFPSGTLHLNLIVPPLCTDETNFMQTTTAANSLQAAVETLALNNTNCGWASYYEYFGRASPLTTLHPGSNADGVLLSTALRNMIYRSIRGAKQIILLDD